MSERDPGRNGHAGAPGDPRTDTDLLHAAVEGELPPAEAAAFEETLQRDPQLARLVGELRGQREALRALPAVDPPAGVLSGAPAPGGPRLERAVLLGEPVGAGPAGPRATGAAPGGFRFPTRWLAAAAALAGVVALGVFATGGDEGPTLADLAQRMRVDPVEEPLAEAERADAAGFGDAEPVAAEPAADAVAAAAPAAPRSAVAGPSLQRAEEVGLDAFLLPEGDAAGPALSRARTRGGDDPEAFRPELLESLSRGERASGLPAWAQARTYLKPPQRRE